MRLTALLLSAALLAGCGADGEPVQPDATARLNITPNGVSLGTRLRIGQGPFSVNLGIPL